MATKRSYSPTDFEISLEIVTKVSGARSRTISRARRSWASLRTDQRKAIAIVSTPASTSASAAAATASSSSSTTTSPSESTRSATPKVRSIGTSGSGLRVSAKRSRFSGGSPVGRPSPRIVRTVSSKPRVVISPIAAPLRSTTMLVATVEPCEISRSIFV